VITPAIRTSSPSWIGFANRTFAVPRSSHAAPNASTSGMGQVRVDGDAGHERAAEAVLSGDLLVVDLVLGARRRVARLDVILGQRLWTIRKGLLH
jgi:hypothetical protein